MNKQIIEQKLLDEPRGDPLVDLGYYRSQRVQEQLESHKRITGFATKFVSPMYGAVLGLSVGMTGSFGPAAVIGTIGTVIMAPFTQAVINSQKIRKFVTIERVLEEYKQKNNDYIIDMTKEMDKHIGHAKEDMIKCYGTGMFFFAAGAAAGYGIGCLLAYNRGQS